MDHYLLFSGGFDSAVVFRELLCDLKTHDKDDINILYISADFTTNKQPNEIISVEECIKYFKKEFEDVWERVYVNSVMLKTDVSLFNSQVGVQSLYWYPTLFSMIKPGTKAIIHDTTTAKDEMAQSVEEFDDCFMNLYRRMTVHTRNYKNGSRKDTLKIEHDLLMWSKADIVWYAATQMQPIFKYLISCEHTRKRVCGGCAKCRETISACQEIIRSASYSDFNKTEEFIENFLLDTYGIKYIEPTLQPRDVIARGIWTNYFSDFRYLQNDANDLAAIIDMRKHFTKENEG